MAKSLLALAAAAAFVLGGGGDAPPKLRTYKEEVANSRATKAPFKALLDRNRGDRTVRTRREEMEQKKTHLAKLIDEKRGIFMETLQSDHFGGAMDQLQFHGNPGPIYLFRALASADWNNDTSENTKTFVNKEILGEARPNWGKGSEDLLDAAISEGTEFYDLWTKLQDAEQ